MVQLFINIDVDDMEKAVAFYRDGLALRTARRLFDSSVVEMTGASSTIHLLAKDVGSSASCRGNILRDYQRHWTPGHLDFVVEDIAASTERAVRAGATLEGEIQTFDWGRLANLSDPFGHGFCLLQFFGKGYDEVT